MRKILKFFQYLLFFIIIVAAGLFVYVKFFVKITERDVYAFVPSDFIYLVEADEPIENWKDFSKTEIWKHLSQNEYMADIDGMADYLDSLITGNKKLFGLVGEKPLIISAHMTKPADYDFIYLMDLKGAAKLGAFMDVLQIILDKLVMPTTKEKIADTDVYLIGEDDDTIYLTVVDNILICSYTKALVEKSINQHKEPYFTENERFLYMTEKTGRSGLCRFYLNYGTMDKFLRVYMDDPGDIGNSIANSLEYATYDVKLTDYYAELDGYTSAIDSYPSMINALKNTDGSRIRAPQILPERTSFFFSINFDSFAEYYKELDNVMKLDEESYKDFKKNQQRIERFLNITLEEHFFSWIGNEITISMLPVDKAGRKQSYLAFFHSPDIRLATEKLNEMLKKFKRNVINPVKFKNYEYKEVEVNYLELKGFFNIFLGKMFGKFDKPKFIAMDEFVVFSNDTTALHRVVDDHMARKTLRNNSEFKKFFDNFSAHSNYFAYVNGKELYPYLPTMGNMETGKGIRKNRRYITCFPHLGLQFREKAPYYRSYIRIDFEPQDKLR